MKMFRSSLLLLLLYSFSIPSSLALTLASGKQQVQLIELYTSEGCSSCPAADHWLGRLQNANGLWTSFVPVAFHVDYWDYLGWEDKYAAHAFSDRQRLHYTQSNLRQVYTPGFVIQGKEWRGWFQREKRPTQSKQIVGNLELKIENGATRIRFNPQAPMEMGIVNFVVLGFGLKNTILAGENAGSDLQHDFVVLEHQHKPTQLSNNTLSAEFILDTSVFHDYTKLAVAAWITPAGQLKPVQVVGGWFMIQD